jgi:uncharacterized iron-regulated membrane protein
MTVAVFAVGVALIVWSIGLTVVYAWILRRREERPGRALRLFVRRPTVWIGIVLVAAAINPVAAAVLVVVYVACAIVLARRLVRRGRESR